MCAAAQGCQKRELCALKWKLQTAVCCPAQHVCWELLQFGPPASGISTLDHGAISQAPYFYFNLKSLFLFMCMWGIQQCKCCFVLF